MLDKQWVIGVVVTQDTPNVLSAVRFRDDLPNIDYIIIALLAHKVYEQRPRHDTGESTWYLTGGCVQSASYDGAIMI